MAEEKSKLSLDKLRELYGKVVKPKPIDEPRKFEDLGRDASKAVVARNDALKEAASYKKGGKVKKTGKALVHKGEVVLTKKQQKKVGTAKVRKAIKPSMVQKKAGMIPKKGK